MGQYTYDETGAVFNYFLLSILSIILVPTTFSLFTAGVAPKKKSNEPKHPRCDCDACKVKFKRLDSLKKKNTSPISLSLLFLVLGWALLVFVAYQVAVAKVEEQGLWDPYQILGVDSVSSFAVVVRTVVIKTSASKAAINKQFRELSLTWHPDKWMNGTQEEKDFAEAKMVEISKARKVLTDEEARKTWDEFGHPDGKQSFSLGIALPKWLVEGKNNWFVLLVYGGVFGVGLPYWVARWWYNAKNVSGDKIQHVTMARFYRDLKDGLPIRALMEMVCKSNELLTAIPYSKSQSAALENLAESVSEEISKVGEKFEYKKKAATLEAAISNKIMLLLMSHLMRVRVKDPVLAEEQRIVAEKSAHVVNGILQIAAARFWLATAIAALDLKQMIVQAAFPQQGPLHQLPHMTPDVLKNFVTKKRQIRTIRELLEMDESERTSLLRSISDSQYKEVMSVAEQYPLMRVKKAKFAVLGEPAITPGSIVTLHVKIELISAEELRREKTEGPVALDDSLEAEEKKAQWFEKKETPVVPIHAPYFPVDRTPVWWIMLADRSNNRLICLGKITDLGPPGSGEKSCRLQFQAPPKAGTWTFHIVIKCDAAMGSEGVVEAKLVVAEPPPEAEDADDDISEPEEDSIAGQMQAMRSGKAVGGGGKKEKVVREENEDSSDSESDDE
ncbi:secretory subunit [Blyttiomyces sp. JEL0837]|nr:secretory subunit [Blyttiomyces sp. JEL0837]